ncbi:MAG TPA: hypothetical protein VJX67_03635 [Blastocatellia bacterium]|nr:hypothetical protein [Blastocatellia bacterium]
MSFGVVIGLWRFRGGGLFELPASRHSGSRVRWFYTWCADTHGGYAGLLRYRATAPGREGTGASKRGPVKLDCYRSFSQIARAMANAINWSPKPSLVFGLEPRFISEFRLLWAGAEVGPGVGSWAQSLPATPCEQSAKATQPSDARAGLLARED